MAVTRTMKDGTNVRETWYDAEAKVSVTVVDVTQAARDLAAGHLSGPTSAYYLAKALAAAALLGSETSEPEEVVSLQMKCKGPLGGFNVECTAAGTLRGYTEKKILEDFDGTGTLPDVRKVVGEKQLQVTRSVPGRILSQALATTLNGYLAQSLQRNAEMRVESSVSDEEGVLAARGVLVEALPDSAVKDVSDLKLLRIPSLEIASRNLLNKLGLKKAVLKKTDPLKFACRCSPERAVAMLAALSPEERKDLPEKIDITCHMCGRTFSVPTH